MPKLFRALCVAAAAAFSTEVTVTRVDEANLEAGALCSPCVQMAGQGLNQLLNYILNVGVVGGCAKLCGNLKNKTEAAVCNVACDVVGIKAFINAIEKADLDPIYFCEVIKSCPAGSDDAAATVTGGTVTPTHGPKGTTFNHVFTAQVTKAMGVGEMAIGITGPGGFQQSAGQLIPKGLAEGTYNFNVNLKLDDDESQDPPVILEPGKYTTQFELCQGECGSKHPHSKDFGGQSVDVTLDGNGKVVISDNIVL
jgi:hypothetical protein